MVILSRHLPKDGAYRHQMPVASFFNQFSLIKKKDYISLVSQRLIEQNQLIR